VVRLSPQARGRLPILLGSTIARAVRETASEPDKDGWVRAVIPIESVEHARVELLKLGEGAEALEPPELRARLAETATALADLYHL
jgi:predicted DNA-binding transcriptional regulator YafY